MPKRYIHGRRNIACVDLIDYLKSIGIVAMVGHKSRSREGKLYVYCQNAEDVPKVPRSFRGWDVEAEVDKGADETQ